MTKTGKLQAKTTQQEFKAHLKQVNWDVSTQGYSTNSRLNKIIKNINRYDSQLFTTQAYPTSAFMPHRKVKFSESVIPESLLQLEKRQKIDTPITKKQDKNSNALISSNLIITGFQLQQKENAQVLDLLVYDVLTKLDNYILLELLNQ